jgi:hypothetical protein
MTRRRWRDGEDPAAPLSLLPSPPPPPPPPPTHPSLSPPSLPPSTPPDLFILDFNREQPHLFSDAVDEQLRRIKSEKEAFEAAQDASSSAADQFQMQLSRRMEEVRMADRKLGVEDIMYMLLVEQFVKLGVELLPPLNGHVDVGPCDLTVLTNGVHSKEAIEVVKEHMMSLMGPANSAYSNTILKSSKLQSAQIYAASVMFG